MSMKELIELYKNKGVIYKLTSPSNKTYIGQTINLKGRFNKYKNKVVDSIGKYLKSAIEKYGFENFKIEILTSIDLNKDIKDSKSILNKLEIEFIEKYDCLAPKGYNLTGGGNGSFKRIITEETRKRLSTANMGKNLINELPCTCSFCKKSFTLKPSIKRRKEKNNKNGTMFCSPVCVGKYNSPLYQKRLKCGMEKVIVSVVSYATDAGLSPAPATNDRYISTILK